VLRVSALTREPSPAIVLGAVAPTTPRPGGAIFGRAAASTAGVVRVFDMPTGLPDSFKRPLRGNAGAGAILPFALITAVLAVDRDVDAEGTRADVAVEGREFGTDRSGGCTFDRSGPAGCEIDLVGRPGLAAMALALGTVFGFAARSDVPPPSESAGIVMRSDLKNYDLGNRNSPISRNGSVHAAREIHSSPSYSKSS
jgi:hypothetical protein